MAMFLPVALYIGLRYTRAKRRNHFISFISLISMLGIALGIAVLITVLSVMNGFDYEIHKYLFNISNQVMISNPGGRINNWEVITKKIDQVKNVVSYAPNITMQGMLANEGLAQGIIVNGVLPEKESKVSIVGDKMLLGNLNALKAGKFNIILGSALANDLNLGIGSKVMLIIPKATLSPIGIMPRFKRFEVVGIFNIGNESGYDSSVAFINLSDAQKLFQFENQISHIRVKVNELYIAPSVANNIAKLLPEGFLVTDWTKQYSTYFKAISMEKNMMFIILLFIIAVAAFNLVSSLVMTVTDKQADIAILRTLGASPNTITSIFIIQGLIIGLVGTMLGVVGGIVLSLNAPSIVHFLEKTFHTQFISASVYFIDYLPSKLDWHNVLHVSLASIAMSLIATIYPALRAAKIQPAEALKYE
jgi:lipoprotein-releasing system permease protein